MQREFKGREERVSADVVAGIQGRRLREFLEEEVEVAEEDVVRGGVGGEGADMTE